MNSVNNIVLRKRILELSYKFGLSHLGSCLSAVDLIDSVYKIKKAEEKFILSNGHAALAWYAVLEKYGYLKIHHLKDICVHPVRNPKIGIHVSTGSLGMGLGVALGMAIAQRDQNFYCMISDGECAEGSVWEALRIACEQKVDNLKLILNANGWGAYSQIELSLLKKRIGSFGYNVMTVDGHNLNQIIKALKTKVSSPALIFAKTIVEHLPFLSGQDAHYYIMKKEDYLEAMDQLK